MKKNHVFLVLFLLMFNPGYSQEITGDWYGIGNFEDIQLRINLHVKALESGYEATFDSPDQEAYDLEVDTLFLTGDIMHLKYGQQGFRGTIKENSGVIEGVWHYPGGTIDLNMARKPLDPPEGSIAMVKQQYSKEEKYITMRDGVRLFTSIYAPKDTSTPRPIIMVRTPYNIEPDQDRFSSRLLAMKQLLAENYIIVFQDVRGRYMSEGVFEDIRPFNPNKQNKEIDENSDTYDTIDWLVKNVPNNNGNVGIFGVSYPGFYSTMSLPDAHPALKAVSPQAPVTNWFIGDDFHHNGAFFLMDAFSFYSGFGRPRPEPTRKAPAPFQFHNNDNYDFYKDIGPVKNVQRDYFGDTIRFWSDLMTHPNYDAFWKERNILPHLTDIKPAVLVVGGWFDAEDLYGPLHTYKAIEKQNASNQNRLMMGPWFHGQWSRAKGEKLGNIHFGSNTSSHYKEMELQFFNYYLKNEGEMNLPEASIFVTGANTWHSFSSWPPQETEQKDLYLHCEEKLSFSQPETKACFVEYVVDPNKPVPYTEDVHLRRTREYLTDDQRFASRRPDVMVYQTEILDKDITVVGPLKIEFFVSTTGTDADYVVKMIDVFPDEMKDYPKNDKNVPMGGYQMLVRGEVLRGKFRNSFENPEAFTPGKITKVSFEIPDTAHQFKKGHRIMIQVQNSWFPLVDINPQKFVNIYEAEEEDFIKATHRIYHDQDRPSKISIQVLKK